MNKKAKLDTDKAVINVWKREVGELSSRNFAHRLGASEDLVLRLDIDRKLERHRGCVNTVSFNGVGDILVSGSDDRRIILWNWETGNVKLSFHSGHDNNVFQAKIMPCKDDQCIVTCAADGQVRHAQISNDGRVETALLGNHQGRAHKLAIEPGSPHIFYTCGEDGMVQHFDLRTGAATELFTCQSIDKRRGYLSSIQLNAIAIDPRNPNLFVVAGSDEYARLYDIRKYKWDGSADFEPVNYYCPPHLIGDEQVGITGLAFSELSELLVSYNDEHIYLFNRDMGLGPNPNPISPVSPSGAASQNMFDSDEDGSPQVYKGHRNCETVKGVNFFGPKCEYVVSGSDCGRIFIWKKKSGELIRVMEGDEDVVNCIEPHPYVTTLASSGIESDIKIWTPKAIERATLPEKIEQKRKPRGWMHRLALPEDLMTQLFSLQRRGSTPESRENSEVGREILEMILTFNANSDGSSDNVDDDSGDTATEDDDCGDTVTEDNDCGDTSIEDDDGGDTAIKDDSYD